MRKYSVVYFKAFSKKKLFGGPYILETVHQNQSKMRFFVVSSRFFFYYGFIFFKRNEANKVKISNQENAHDLISELRQVLLSLEL